MAATEKKKYTPEVLKTFRYKGYLVQEIRNRKTKRAEFKTRIQMNRRRQYLIAETRERLYEMIDDFTERERRIKKGLPTEKKIISPTLHSLFERDLQTMRNNHQQKFKIRVFENFLNLLESGIRVTELKKSHFQLFIDERLKQNGKQSNQPIKPATIKKELSVISAALGRADLYFHQLDGWIKPKMPPVRGKIKERERIVSEAELSKLLTTLRKPHKNEVTYKHRRRLADELEFRYESGLRRKEVVRLKKNQYLAKEKKLRDVIRFKTDTITPVYPLTARACEIIESRIKQNQDGEFIFSRYGKNNESDYRTLKQVCRELGLPYGRYTEGGFVGHDFRHTFASELILNTDIKTTSVFLGHTNIEQAAKYIHTNEARMREAIRRKEGGDRRRELIDVYKKIRRRKMTAREFLEFQKIFFSL